MENALRTAFRESRKREKEFDAKWDTEGPGFANRNPSSMGMSHEDVGEYSRYEDEQSHSGNTERGGFGTRGQTSHEGKEWNEAVDTNRFDQAKHAHNRPKTIMGRLGRGIRSAVGYDAAGPWNSPVMAPAPRKLFNLQNMPHHEPSHGHPPTGTVPYAEGDPYAPESSSDPFEEPMNHENVQRGGFGGRGGGVGAFNTARNKWLKERNAQERAEGSPLTPGLEKSDSQRLWNRHDPYPGEDRYFEENRLQNAKRMHMNAVADAGALMQWEGGEGEAMAEGLSPFASANRRRQSVDTGNFNTMKQREEFAQSGDVHPGVAADWLDEHAEGRDRFTKMADMLRRLFVPGHKSPTNASRYAEPLDLHDQFGTDNRRGMVSDNSTFDEMNTREQYPENRDLGSDQMMNTNRTEGKMDMMNQRNDRMFSNSNRLSHDEDNRGDFNLNQQDEPDNYEGNHGGPAGKGPLTMDCAYLREKLNKLMKPTMYDPMGYSHNEDGDNGDVNMEMDGGVWPHGSHYADGDHMTDEIDPAQVGPYGPNFPGVIDEGFEGGSPFAPERSTDPFPPDPRSGEESNPDDVSRGGFGKTHRKDFDRIVSGDAGWAKNRARLMRVARLQPSYDLDEAREVIENFGPEGEAMAAQAKPPDFRESVHSRVPSVEHLKGAPLHPGILADFIDEQKGNIMFPAKRLKDLAAKLRKHFL